MRVLAVGLAALVALLAPAACGEAPDPAFAPRTPADGRLVADGAPDRAVVWAVGDGANGSERSRRLAGQIARSGRVDRLLYLGDVYPDGSARDFAEGFDRVDGPLRSRTAPTPGNHEWPNHLEGYDPYWARVHRRPTPPWYAFRAGGWQVLSLNSEEPTGPGSPQHAFVRAAVGGGGSCRLAIWHRPRFSAGKDHGDQDETRPLWDLLAGRARLVLSGHDHDLQRLRPVDGITQLVSGAGGRRLDGVDEGDERLAFADAEHFGALRVELRPGRADLAFVALGGRVLDRASVACEPGR